MTNRPVCFVLSLVAQTAKVFEPRVVAERFLFRFLHDLLVDIFVWLMCLHLTLVFKEGVNELTRVLLELLNVGFGYRLNFQTTLLARLGDLGIVLGQLVTNLADNRGQQTKTFLEMFQFLQTFLVLAVLEVIDNLVQVIAHSTSRDSRDYCSMSDVTEEVQEVLGLHRNHVFRGLV